MDFFLQYNQRPRTESYICRVNRNQDSNWERKKETQLPDNSWDKNLGDGGLAQGVAEVPPL